MGSLVVLMGPTGAGKSVQGELLAKYYHGVHMSSGNLLREDPKAAAMMVDGSLVPADEVERVVGEAMEKVPENTLVILDGTPRTQSNIRWIDANLPRLHRELAKVIVIELDLETSMKRLGLRGRADDAPAAVRAKWELFESTTKPVVEHYRKLGLLSVVDGRGSIEEVQELIRGELSGVLA